MSNTRPSSHEFATLDLPRPGRGKTTGDLAPQRPRWRGIVHLVFTPLCVGALLWAPASARAEAERGAFVAVAAVGSAVRVEEAWDSGFGGEVGLGWAAPGARGAAPLGAWAVSIGALAFSERSGGRGWLETSVGTRWPFGWLVGVGAGPTVELDRIRKPRWGAQATVWAFTGVMPYARFGAVEEGGAFVDLGVRIAFPAIRW